MTDSADRLSLRERVRLADTVRSRKAEVAEVVTSEFLRRHPEWVRKYGDRARKHGIEDALFHIDFIAAAIECGSPDSFGGYARWTARMLDARGIGPEFVAENFVQIGEALASAATPAEARLIEEVVQSGCAACAASALTPEADRTSLSDLRALYVDAILSGQRDAATNLAFGGLRESGSIVRVYTEIFQEAQYELGRRWEANRISVAQEHLATAISQHVLGRLYSHVERLPPTRGRVLVTGVQGEMHQLGANMVADVFETEGWDVRFLGTNLPNRDIVESIVAFGPQVVGISATMLFSVPTVRLLVEEVRDRMGSTVRILLGGSAFRLAEEVWKEMGADGYAGDLVSALELLKALAPEPPAHT